MCYHYSVPDAKILEERFKARLDPSISFSRIFHVSGFSKPQLPVITNEDTHQIQLLRWGLIPSWVKDKETAAKFSVRTLNARFETIHEKPTFRHLISTKRCLVLADGFFEWRHYQNRTYPYYIQLLDRSPFAFAGLWGEWENPVTGEIQKTYTIITTRANALLEIVHNKRKRMPVILHPPDEARWLSQKLTREEIDNILGPFDAGLMTAHPVSRLITAKHVNSNVPDAIMPKVYPELPSLP